MVGWLVGWGLCLSGLSIIPPTTNVCGSGNIKGTLHSFRRRPASESGGQHPLTNGNHLEDKEKLPETLWGPLPLGL